MGIDVWVYSMGIKGVVAVLCKMHYDRRKKRCHDGECGARLDLHELAMAQQERWDHKPTA